MAGGLHSEGVVPGLSKVRFRCLYFFGIQDDEVKLLKALRYKRFAYISQKPECPLFSLLLGKPETDIVTNRFLHLGYRDRPSGQRAIPVLADKLHDIGLPV